MVGVAMNIVHDTGKHFIVQTAKGFEVYRNETTFAVRCATIGFTGDEGMRRSLKEIERREKP
jgi:hypothetical protein